MASVAVIGSSGAEAPVTAESLFGPSDLAAIVGNGQLTVGVNRSGRITSCRWPGPGFYENISYATQSRSEPLLGVESWHGASWALKLGDQLIWMHDDRWSHDMIANGSEGLIEIESKLDGQDVRARQQFAVAEDGNAFVARITVSGTFDAPPNAFWYANFTPSTRIIPRIPIATHDRDDFAAFVDPIADAICHFRPTDPPSHVWRAARDMADHGINPLQWGSFPDGTYIICGSRQTKVGVTVGPDQGPTSVASQVSAGTLSPTIAIVGQTASACAIELSPLRDGYTAAMFTAFGPTYNEAGKRYYTASEKDISTASESPNENLSDAEWIMHRAMATIRTCTDTATGSVVRAPTNTPPLAIDWPRYGVWIARAHNAAGDHEGERRLLSFYANHVRTKSDGNLPHGSIPAALYTNGIEAVPEAIIDAAAAGRVLWAIEHHGSLLELDLRRAFYTDLWEEVSAIADFLVQWREPGGTAPLYTFDYESMRDRRTTELYVTSYLGVRAANTIANAITQSRPNWSQAAAELRDALQLHAFLPNGEMAIANPGMLYDTGIIPAADLFDWPSAIRGMLRDTGGRLDTETLDHLAKLVLSARDLPEDLHTEITSRLRRQLTHATPDAADAAFAYLIAHRLHTLKVSPPRPIQELSPDTP